MFEITICLIQFHACHNFCVTCVSISVILSVCMHRVCNADVLEFANLVRTPLMKQIFEGQVKLQNLC